MGKKMYVGNLPRSVDQPTLEKKFGQFGTVQSANLITDKVSGQCKGFGFVEMSSAEEAKNAIEHLNGADFDDLGADRVQTRGLQVEGDEIRRG